MRLLSRMAELWQRREVMPLMLLIIIFFLTLMLIGASEKDAASRAACRTADQTAVTQACPCPKP